MATNTNESTVKAFSKDSDLANMHTESYLVKLSALLFLRAITNQQKFSIASNMKAVASFDDVVFTINGEAVFLHLKYTENMKNKISLSQLISVQEDFSLLKYCKSYIEVKKQWGQTVDLQHCGKFENCLFVVYTNARMHGSLGSAVTNTELHDIISSGGKCIQFTEDHDTELIHIFRNFENYKQILNEAISNRDVSDIPELLEAVQKLHNCNTKTVPSIRELQKLLKDLESLGDLSDFREFLSHMYFCTEQATEKQLSDLIRKEIAGICGTDSVFDRFLQGVQDWWRNSDMLLTCETQFWQDIVQLCVANITDRKFDKLSALNIQFIKNECQSFTSKFTNTCRILLINSDCTTISCLKILQTLQFKFVTDINILKSNLKEILVMWKLGICGDVLIVEGVDNILVDLAPLLEVSPNKKIIIVASNIENVPYELLQQFECETIRDIFIWKHLNSDTQSQILGYEIIFQGYPVRFALLVQRSLLQNIITSNMVLDILTGQCNLQVGCMMNNLDDSYISRTFLRKEILRQDILYNKEIGHLAITGMSLEDLQHLVPAGEKINKCDCRRFSNFMSKAHYRYFIINDFNDFTALAKIYKTVHWIHRCDKGFLWRNSIGDISVIKNYLQENTSTYANIMDVMKLPQQMVLLVAQPGMGKSTELSHLTSLLKKEDPSMWVVRVNLNNHVDYLSHSSPHVLELLMEASQLSTQFERCLLEYQIQKKGNIVVMFDGYDEISPNFSDKINGMLRKLSATKIKNIFITTRPIMGVNLERELCTLPFLFKSFTEHDQGSLLLNIWQIPSGTVYDPSKFISELLNFTTRSVNDIFKEYAGIPLQTKMLAEIFRDDALHYIKTGEIKLTHKLSSLRLFNDFVDCKLEVCYKKTKVDITEDFKDLKSKLLQNHMNCALVSLLDIDGVKKLKNSKSILEDHKNFVEKFKMGCNKTGIIIDVINEKVVFIHHTFTEYFVAKWFSRNIFSLFERTSSQFYRKWYNAIVKVFGNNGIKVYFREEIFFKYQTVQRIFNLILAENLKLHMAVLNEDTLLVKSLLCNQNFDVNEVDRGGRTPLHLAVINFLEAYDDETKTSAEEVMNLLLEHDADLKIEDKVFFWSPLRLAVKVRAWSAVDLFLEKQVEHKDLEMIMLNIKNDLYKEEMLRVIAEQGLVRLLEFILKCGISINVGINAGHCSKCTMLHIASRHGHLRFVEFLLDHRAHVDSQECTLKRTPLMWAVDHGKVQVVELLVSKKNADVSVCDIAGNTALHLVLKRFQGKSHYKIVTMKPDNEAQLTEEETDSYNEWKIIEILLKFGGDFSTCDRNGDTVLHICAMYGKRACVMSLLKMKVDLTVKNKYGETALLTAAKYERWDVVILLLENGSDVNDTGENNNTVAHIAARFGNEICLKYLWETAADLNVTNKFKETPLLVAAKSRQWDIIPLMLKFGCKMNDFDESGNTALHMAARYNSKDCVTMLLDLKADLNVKNKRQETPLLTATMFKNWSIVRILLQYNADMTAYNSNKDSVLHLAARYGDIESVRLLVDMKTDINILNKCNETPLCLGVLNRNWDVVAFLLKEGADISVVKKSGSPILYLVGRYGNAECVELLYDRNTQDENYNNVLHIASRYGNKVGIMRLLNKKVNLNEKNNRQETPILKAAQNKQWEIVKMLLYHGADIQYCDMNGNTILHFASRYGNIETVIFLVKLNTNLDVRNTSDETPLITAAYNCEWEIASVLLQHGADLTSCDNHGNTILHIAAAFGNKDYVKLLLKMKTNLNVKNSFGETPIMTAADCKEWEIVILLLHHGADVTSCDKHGNVLLHIAAKHGSKECIMLLSGMNANLHMRNNSEETPLITAASNDKWEIVTILLKNGADLMDCDKNGNSILHIAAKCGNKQIVMLLLDMNANLNIKNKLEETPLVTAANNNKWNIVKLFIKHGVDAEAYGSRLHGAISCGDIKCVSSFLDCGLDVNCTFSTGVTPLWVAAYLGQLQVAELLCDHGADMHFKYPAASCTMGGYTPLHIAASCGKAKLVRCLLNRGAKLMVCDSKGQTALHIAAVRGELRVVQCLLQHGASLDACDDKGLTPLQSAVMTVDDQRYCDIRSRISAVIQFLESYDGNPNNIHIDRHSHAKCNELNYVCM